MFGLLQTSAVLVAGLLSAAVFFVDTITPTSLKLTYRDAGVYGPPVKILIVPGHEPNYGGAEYSGLRERDMNVTLSQKIAEYLSADPRISVTIARDKKSWEKNIGEYLSQNYNEIVSWRRAQAAIMNTAMASGTVSKVKSAPHNNAAPGPGVRLYGLNKWAGENKYDISIHVHFNDDGSRKWNAPGEYSGFTIYVPEKQMSNSKAAQALAKSVDSKLLAIMPHSNLKQESAGVVEDQELIATGAFNSADTANMLIEYGYIYEPQFQNKAKREPAFDSYAEATAKGIISYLSAK